MTEKEWESEEIDPKTTGALSQHFKPLICPVDSNIQTELKEEGERERGRLPAMQGVFATISNLTDGSVIFWIRNIIHIGNSCLHLKLQAIKSWNYPSPWLKPLACDCNFLICLRIVMVINTTNPKPRKVLPSTDVVWDTRLCSRYARPLWLAILTWRRRRRRRGDIILLTDTDDDDGFSKGEMADQTHSLTNVGDAQSGGVQGSTIGIARIGGTLMFITRGLEKSKIAWENVMRILEAHES